MEADYIACNTAASNAIWIKEFVDILKLGIPNKLINVFYGNKYVISLIKKWSTKL
jgi:hypothetical protein